MLPVIYADLRCLQDAAYQFRGIGHHTAALLRARKNSRLINSKLVGLVDSRRPPLPSEFAILADQITFSLNPCSNGKSALFIEASPMTHDTRFGLRFQNHPAFLRAAVIYDFIPMDWPGYLPTVAVRIEYLSKVSRLKGFDLFFPISEYSGWRTSELLGVSRDRIKVTGASVRRSLSEIRDRAATPQQSPYDKNEPFFLTLGGDDPRKNTEVAIKAVRHLNLLYSRRIPLKVVGHYSVATKTKLLRLAGHGEGAGFLEFHPDIPDEELVSLFGGAVATIAPSHIEGFSLPIPEASVCGCPVVASTCAAQMELVEQHEALFQSDDAVALSEKLDALLHDPDLRAYLVASQAYLGPKFDEDEVGARFWRPLEEAVERRITAAISKARKPRLAFLSPYPPDQSGVALYTANTMRGGENLFSSDLYTAASRPLTFEGSFRDAGPVSLAPLLDGRYNGVISVLGNSHYHTSVFEVFERFGGPCILHDSRLTHIYFHRLGEEAFLNFAARLLGRPVSMDEVHVWLQDRTPPSLFLEPIIERASPLIVHTVTQQALLKERYGADAYVTTCCPTVFFDDDELTASAKQTARRRHGISSAAFLVSSFGYVARTKGMECCILALDFLRGWNIPAELHFVGNAGALKGELDRISGLYGVAKHVHCLSEFVDDAMYRDMLIASDAAVQLRSYGFGQLSAALTDCISAGLPCVASRDLANSCDAPAYVSIVPDQFSPLQVAEQLATIWETKPRSASHADERATYLQTHNFEYYGKRLVEILGVA